MKRLVTAPVFAVLAAAAMTSTAAAGPQQAPPSDARFAIHVSAPTTKATTVCSTYSPLDPAHPGGQLNCPNWVTTGNTLSRYYAYLLATRVTTSGIAGVSMGIEYNGNGAAGVDVFGWFQCADGNFYASAGPRGEFPASGGGMRLTWLTCQTETFGADSVNALMGALDVYVYSADRLKITPNRPLESGPELLVASCAAAESEVDTMFHAGWAEFGNGKPGCNPCLAMNCDPTPTKSSTWGKIKNLYGN